MSNIKRQAAKLLDRLVELDTTTTAAYYEMGRLLSAIEHGRLFDVLGFDSMAHLVDQELSFTASTASKYVRTYRQVRRLKYTKDEALALFLAHSFTRVADVLPALTSKLGSRAIGHRIDNLDFHQINFALSEAEYDEVVVALKRMGASIVHGRLQNSSEALIELIRATVRRAA